MAMGWDDLAHEVAALVEYHRRRKAAQDAAESADSRTRRR